MNRAPEDFNVAIFAQRGKDAVVGINLPHGSWMGKQGGCRSNRRRGITPAAIFENRGHKGTTSAEGAPRLAAVVQIEIASTTRAR